MFSRQAVEKPPALPNLRETVTQEFDFEEEKIRGIATKLVLEWMRFHGAEQSESAELYKSCLAAGRALWTSCEILGLDSTSVVLKIQPRLNHTAARAQFSWLESNGVKQPCITFFVVQKEWQLPFFRHVITEDIIHETGEWWLTTHHLEYVEREESRIEAELATLGKEDHGKVSKEDAMRLWRNSPKEQAIETYTRALSRYLRYGVDATKRVEATVDFFWTALKAGVGVVVVLAVLAELRHGVVSTAFGELTQDLQQAAEIFKAEATTLDLSNPDADFGDNGEPLTTGDVKKLVRLLERGVGFTFNTTGLTSEEIEGHFQTLGDKFDKLVGNDPSAVQMLSRETFLAALRTHLDR